jgi:putative intracellular protease/amidase
MKTKILFILFALFHVFLLSAQEKKLVDTTATKLPKLTLVNHQRIMTELLGEPKIDIREIGIFVYDGFNTIEALGAMSVFSEMMNVKVRYIAPSAGWIKSELGLEIFVEENIEKITELDLLFVPGGTPDAVNNQLKEEKVTNWLNKIDQTTKLTASSGLGTFLIGNTGVLKDKSVSLDWYEAASNAAIFGGKWMDKRYINDGKYWTSVGQTGTIDMTLAMLYAVTSKNHVQGAMLDLEYDPQPPLNGGTKALTPEKILQPIQANVMELQFGYKTFINPHVSLDQASENGKTLKTIGILVYDNFFTLDAIGPIVALSQIPDIQIKLIAKEKGELKTGRTLLKVNNVINEIPNLDVLVVPGGAISTFNASRDTVLLNWTRKIDAHSLYTTSVCTGSWILGNAGLLKGKSATSHWYRAQERLEYYGANYKKARYTNDGKYWTSAGVSAGIDFSFALMKELYGNDFVYFSMLNLNYHPEPLIQGGIPEKSNPLVADMMMQMYDYGMLPLFKKERKKNNR